MNRTKKLWNPLPTIVKRTLALTTSRCSFHASTSRFPSSSSESSRRVLFISRHDSLGSFQFSGRSFFSSESNSKCWNCGCARATMPFLFCESCRTVQPVDVSVDYFQIFGLDKKYDMDVGSLEGKYKDWQKKLHPDLVHTKSKKERGYAAEQSARVIDAYRTLTKPLSRAIYAMRLDGVNVNEEETITDPELLAEIMELREAVEEAVDSQALRQIQFQVQEKLKHWSDAFAKAFHSQQFDEAVMCIRRMTYYDRANEEIIKKL